MQRLHVGINAERDRRHHRCAGRTRLFAHGNSYRCADHRTEHRTQRMRPGRTAGQTQLGRHRAAHCRVAVARGHPEPLDHGTQKSGKRLSLVSPMKLGARVGIDKRSALACIRDIGVVKMHTRAGCLAAIRRCV